MTFWASTLELECDRKGCGARTSIPNPDRIPLYLLEREAQLREWFVAFGGEILCPKHHMAEADKLHLKSLYILPGHQTVPIEKAQKKGKVKTDDRGRASKDRNPTVPGSSSLPLLPEGAGD
jgi:hypothetical protein